MQQSLEAGPNLILNSRLEVISLFWTVFIVAFIILKTVLPSSPLIGCLKNATQMMFVGRS